MAKELTVERSMADFKKAWEAKRKLIERQKEDFLFALGKQWDDETLEDYKRRKIKPVTDNRIQPNIFLLTGLERQNRSEFRAYPEGQEDSLKAEIASGLFKHAIKTSDFLYKTSEQFKDGVTCGESHLELYLDHTYNLLNGKPIWRKADGDCIFPEPGFREYDFNDARYVFKLTKDLSEDDLISLFPKKKKQIEGIADGKVNFEGMSEGSHVQKRDYPTTGGESGSDKKEKGFDLLERYYKKFVDKHFVGDKSTGIITEAEDESKAKGFVEAYQQQILQDQTAYDQAAQQFEFDTLQYNNLVTQAGGIDALVNAMPPTPPPPPPEHDPERYIHFTRRVPEMWYFAQVPGLTEPLADEVAWFYPLWKNYPFIPYFARFSTAPLTGDDRHLLVQGIVHGVKNVQEVANKAKTLELLHLNSTTNSGWLAEEDSWVDEKMVKQFGATPGVNLYYKKGTQPPSRIAPNALSQGHAQIAQESMDSIKGGLGINADLLAAQDSSSSGRAIALRQKQGLLMVQELFDNLSRSRQIAGKLLLSQMGEMYDTDTAKKVLGEAFLMTNFGVVKQIQQMDPMTGQPVMAPEIGPDGQPVKEIDFEAADAAIAEVLSGELENYDVVVGESVSSETMKMANNADLKEFSDRFPGLLPPDLIIEESLLPTATKSKALSSIKAAQAAAAAQPQLVPAGR